MHFPPPSSLRYLHIYLPPPSRSTNLSQVNLSNCDKLDATCGALSGALSANLGSALRSLVVASLHSARDTIGELREAKYYSNPERNDSPIDVKTISNRRRSHIINRSRLGIVFRRRATTCFSSVPGNRTRYNFSQVLDHLEFYNERSHFTIFVSCIMLRNFSHVWMRNRESTLFTKCVIPRDIVTRVSTDKDHYCT